MYEASLLVGYADNLKKQVLKRN